MNWPRPCLMAALAMAGLLAASGALSARQQPPPPVQRDQPVFRSGVQIVEVDVRVFDRDGRFVADLTRSEFELLENGVPQTLQTLYLVEEAASPAAGGPAPPVTEPFAPRAPAAPPASARQTWIFVFDLNHLTPGAGFERARKAVDEFIRDRFKEGDLAGVVAGSKMVNNRLTSVREELVAAVSGIRPLADARNRQIELTREWPRLVNEFEVLQIANEDREALSRAVMRACTDDPGACGRVPPDLAVREKARRLQREIQRATMETLTAMNALASGLARMTGPKTIVFLSDGFVVQDIETTLRQVVGQAARAGARVYAIDVRGLNRGRGGAIIDQVAAVDEAGAFTSFDPQEDGSNSLAVDTGGMMIRNENNIGRALDRIARDANRYYVLGYQPTNTVFDATFRPIEVRVTRAGVRVRARRGYLALEPAQMLVAQPIGSPAPIDEDPAAGGDPAPGAPVTDPAAETATGTIVSDPAAAAAGGVRLRPDAGERIRALSDRDTAAAGDLATRGWDAYERGDVETALDAFTAAAERPDVRPWVLYALGLSQVALGRPVDAVASWERVRQAAPEFAPVYMDLADTYVQLAELTRALEVLRDAEARWPADPDVHNPIGVIHVRRGALDEAIAAFSRAAGAAPDEPLAFFNLGRAYELRFARGQRYVSSRRQWVASDDDRQRAVESYRRCVELGGPYATQAAEALSRLAWIKK